MRSREFGLMVHVLVDLTDDLVHRLIPVNVNDLLTKLWMGCSCLQYVKDLIQMHTDK
jgi:hypothetical protein